MEAGDAFGAGVGALLAAVAICTGIAKGSAPVTILKVVEARALSSGRGTTESMSRTVPGAELGTSRTPITERTSGAGSATPISRYGILEASITSSSSPVASRTGQ